MKKETWNLTKAFYSTAAILGWHEPTIKKVGVSKEANIFGLFWLVVTGIVLVINTAIEMGASVSQYFVGPIIVIISVTLTALILHGIAKAFHGKGHWTELTRVLAYFSPISFVSLMQVETALFSWLVALYCFLSTAKYVSVIEKISYPKAITVTIIPIVITLITISIVVLFLRQTVISGLTNFL